jgi:hypothetical protein
VNPFDRLHAAVEQGEFSRRVLPELAVGRSPIPPMDSIRAPVPELGPGRRPTVSVIIPCYNYGRFLPNAVHSALDQRDVAVEVIVVDDASTDDSLRTANRLGEGNACVHVLANDRNLGHVATFNRGYEAATGEFIVRLDADDMLTPGSLSRAVTLFDAFPSVGLVYGHPRHFSSATPPAPRETLRGWTVWTGRAWLAQRCRAGTNCITTPEAVLRASVMHEVGGLDTRLHYAQDMEMWLRVASVSDVGHVDGPDQALHRDHPASMSVTEGAGVLTDIAERRAVFEAVFDGPAKALPNADELHVAARRRLAEEALDRACRAYDRGKATTEPISEYVAFALETYPQATQLPRWRALAARRRIGARHSRYVPTFFAGAVARRMREERSFLRWQRTGL